MIAAVFIAALSVAVTFLATVHWLPLWGEEPAMVAPRGHSGPSGAPQASDGVGGRTHLRSRQAPAQRPARPHGPTHNHSTTRRQRDRR